MGRKGGAGVAIIIMEVRASLPENVRESHMEFWERAFWARRAAGEKPHLFDSSEDYAADHQLHLLSVFCVFSLSLELAALRHWWLR